VRRVAEGTGGGVVIGRSVLGGTEIQLRLQTSIGHPAAARSRRRPPARVRLVR
jgi:hypothetical protein